MPPVQPSAEKISATDATRRGPIVAASLLALFLGALDALVVSAAMPSVVADLGGIERFSWVWSAYFLARAVSLPVFGKMADAYRTRRVFSVAIVLFTASSLLAGAAPDIDWLIAARVLQGVGSGGIFALVYTVLTDVSPPGMRARTLSAASVVWGVASVMGPTLGGVVVTWFSWRWIFLINVPLGLLSLGVILAFMAETRPRPDRPRLDLAGIATLTTALLSLLAVFTLGGSELAWSDPRLAAVGALAAVSLAGFWIAERRASDPILSPAFLARRGFRNGNAAVFFSSFAIFAFFAYAPLYLQVTLGETPLTAGTAMLSLSLGWSVGSVLLGRLSHRMGMRAAAICGGAMMLAGSALAAGLPSTAGIVTWLLTFQVVGIGMGFVVLATLLIVQDSLAAADLGVATAAHQLARTLGGTVGVGVCGGLVSARLWHALDAMGTALAESARPSALESLEHLLQPELAARLAPQVRLALQEAVADGVGAAYRAVTVAALLCLLACWRLPRAEKK